MRRTSCRHLAFSKIAYRYFIHDTSVIPLTRYSSSKLSRKHTAYKRQLTLTVVAFQQPATDYIA